MLSWLSLAVFAAAALGLAACAAQLLAARAHFRARRPPALAFAPPISVLKPLCGADDDLAANIESFADLDYPDYEVLLGVADPRDPALAVARAAAARRPDRFRVVLQRGAPGLNRKVNQLVSLAAEARGAILVVSDSNVRVAPNYLRETAALLADPRAGLVTHPIAGAGGCSAGAAMDNLQLAAGVSTGMIAAQRLGGHDIVVGKSMGLRRSDVGALGGFASLKDVLAEDYVLGRRVGAELGKRVVVASTPIVNVCRERSVRDFAARFARWGVIQRTAVGRGVYSLQLLLHPLPLALLGAALAPGFASLGAVAAVALSKALLDGAAARLLAGAAGDAESAAVAAPRRLALVAVKDLALFGAFAYGFFRSTVEWRGARLRVTAGTRLVPLASVEVGASPAPAAAR